MQILSHRKVLLSLGVVFSLSAIGVLVMGSPSAYGIYQGFSTEENLLPKTVFDLNIGGFTIGTATAIKHGGIDHRCLVSAQHIPLQKKFGIQSKEVAVDGMPNQRLKQKVASTMSMGTPEAMKPMSDLRVVWATDIQDPDDHTLLKPEDYEGKPIGSASLAEMDDLAKENPDNITVYSKPHFMHGFGQYIIVDNKPVGEGVLRWAKGKLISYLKEAMYSWNDEANAKFFAATGIDPKFFSGNNKGAIFVSRGDIVLDSYGNETEFRHETCSGDSGGPLFKESDGEKILIGVLSGSTDDCSGNPNARNIYTALNNSDESFESPEEFPPSHADMLARFGNEQRLKYMINATCGKKINFNVMGPGKVITDAKVFELEKYETGPLNKNIVVGEPVTADDKEEIVHQGETFKFKAIPNEGFVFKGFKFLNSAEYFEESTSDADYDTAKKLPCKPDTPDDICEVDFDSTGFSTKVWSYDNVSVVAEFVESMCGDGHIDADEQCDDGNMIGGDGCTVVCSTETSSSSSASSVPPSSSSSASSVPASSSSSAPSVPPSSSSSASYSSSSSSPL